MGINKQKWWLYQFIPLTIILMLAGLFTSRVLLSVGMISFLLLTCVHKNILAQLKTFSKTPVLVALSLLFFIPFISGLWSEDIAEWQNVIRIKLPLLLLPIAFAGKWRLSEKQWQLIGLVFLGFVFVGCCWSLWQYFQNIESINQSYLRAKSIPTPLQNDHIRFSLLVTTSIILCFLLLNKSKPKNARLLLGALILFFTIYLHIIVARTGLIALYIFFIMLAFYWLVTKRNFKQAIIIAFLLIATPVAASFLLPSFKNRISYILYDFSFIKKETYLPGANDGNRLLSIKAGWDILKNNPLGVGAGDVTSETNEWYQDNIPGMLPTDKYKPSSEWLMYGSAAGWIGVLLFTISLIIPLIIKNVQHRFFWISLNIIAAFSFIFDIGLEVQFGVFIYSFIVLWWYKWFSSSEASE